MLLFALTSKNVMKSCHITLQNSDTKYPLPLIEKEVMGQPSPSAVRDGGGVMQEEDKVWGLWWLGRPGQWGGPSWPLVCSPEHTRLCMRVESSFLRHLSCPARLPES